jgi:hypothetical protein
MDDKKQILVHCNKCRGVLLKNLDAQHMEGSLSFLIRCPHCTKDCRLNVEVGKQPIITVE